MIMAEGIEVVLSQWARLGVLFNVAPARRTPDVEALLVVTARVLPGDARLLATVVTWLALYERLVARHRLARMARELEESDASAALGLLLDLARERTGTDHLNVAIGACRPCRRPRPLFLVDRTSAALARNVHREATRTARRWGLWTPAPDLKEDAIRPADWLMSHNADLRFRAIFWGNLRASVLACLIYEPRAGQSESSLARACGATRVAVREALDHLEFCGLVLRQSDGWRTGVKPRLDSLVA